MGWGARSHIGCISSAPLIFHIPDGTRHGVPYKFIGQ